MSTKRILSLVLALVMVLGTFGTVFAASTGNEKVDWLLEQGIVTGNESGDLMLDKTIDRASVAKMVVEALNSKAAAAGMQGYKAPFADVPVSHWSNGNIQVVNGLGLMIGNNGKFMPSAEISYNEVITILVRMVNGLTAEETKTAVWPATYIAKASDLGLLEGLTATNFGAAAIRQDILELFYNAMVNKEAGHYSIVKAIVLENDRITRVGANEVTVEVIKEVQRANFVDANRADLKGEQYTYELPAKYNAEDLLGKVVDLSINKDNKVVEVKVDTTYEVLAGKVSGISASRLTIGGKQYIVNLDERYNREDERVYRTYLNDKALKYVDFAKDNTAVEYARVTVKAGKVLFVDAFNFDDIMPVKEVKEVRGKATILSYDDVRNNNLIEKTVSDARVILVNDKKFTRGTLEDVKANNVLHVYKVGSVDKYIVLQDSAILGKLDRITREDIDRTGYEYGVVVEGKTYVLPDVSPKQAVYEYEADGRFYTLEADRANITLDNFRGKDVKVLLSLGNRVQYIGSDVGFSDYVGIATKIVGDQLRALNPENKENDYRANLDTKIVAGGTTGHKNLNNIDKNALVYINADENSLTYVEDLTNYKAINDLTLRVLKVGTTDYRITDDTVIYLINTKGVASATTAKVVSDRYKKLNDTIASTTATATDKAAAATELAAIRVSFINETDFEELSGRGNRYATPNHVHTMVIKDMNLTVAGKDAIYAKLVGHTDRYTDKTIFDVELANGTTRTFTTYTETGIAANWERGAIYKIVESKTTDNVATSVEKVAFTANYAEIESIQGGKYVFVDGTHKYQTNSTQLFGSTPRVGHKIAYLVDSTFATDMVVIVNPGYVGAITTTTGVVTYIDSSRLELDNKVTHVINADTKYVKNGVTIAMGTNIRTFLNVTDQVTFKDNIITFVSTAADRLQAEAVALATAAVVKAETSKLAADITAAQTLVTGLVAGTAKTDLQARLNAIVLPETDLQKATAAVVKAETSKLQADVDAAQLLVNALPAGADKVALNLRLNGISVVAPVLYTAVSTTTGKEAVSGSALVPAVKATKTVDTDIVLTAVTGGVAGNNITFAVAQGTGDSVELSINVTGNDIKVTLPTDAAGTAIPVDRDDLVAAINADTNAKALVVASGGTATATAVVPRVALAGGVNEIPAVTATPAVAQVYTLTITNGATATGNITVKGVGADETVAVVDGMTAEMVAQAIAADAGLVTKATAAGYTMSVVGNKVVFTANVAGAVGSTGPAAITVTVQ